MDVQCGEMPSTEVYTDEEMKKFVIKFLEEVADIYIKNYVAADNIIIQYEVNNAVYTVDLDEESTGFKFLFALAPAIKKAIENGDSIEINGVDGILHPLVIQKLKSIVPKTFKFL